MGLACVLGAMAVAAAPAVASSGGRLHAFGSNSFGELGSAPNNSPNPTPMPVGLPGASGPVVQVAAGFYYSLAVTSTGQLYAFGNNHAGQLGFATSSGTNNPNPTPTLVGLPGAGGPVVQVAAGADHSLAVTSTGQLYAFGDDLLGELGIAANDGVNPTPVLVGLPGATGPVVQVAAGGRSSLAVTSTGQLYAFGDGSSGQLGSFPEEPFDLSSPTPKLVGLPGASGPVVQVASGAGHSLAVTSSGQLYAFGSNDSGQLGSGINSGPTRSNLTPTLVRLPGAIGPVVQVAAGGHHSLAVTSTGQLYSFGGNYNGQLGNGTNNGPDSSNPTPTLVVLPGATGPVVQVAAGYINSLAVTSTGQLYAFGDDSYGQLGSWPENPADFFSPTPTLVSLPDGMGVQAVARGPDADHALVVLGNASVAGFPSNQFTVRHIRLNRRGRVEFDLTVTGAGELDVLETNWTPSPPTRAHTVLLRPGPDRYAFARRHLYVARAGTLHVTVLPGARGARQVRHHYRRVRINLWVTYQPTGDTPATVGFIDLFVTR
jgi:alpha-tubulin suppressor-like RCC1 family protein